MMPFWTCKTQKKCPSLPNSVKKRRRRRRRGKIEESFWALDYII